MATMSMDFGGSRLPRRAATRVAPAPSVRLTVRGRRLVFVLVLLVATILAFVAMSALRGASVAALAQTPATSVSVHSVVVKPGDTLWTIAARELPGVDPIEGVGRIRTLNAMTPTATLVAGSTLGIPSL